MAVRAADPVGEGTWQERGEHAARERRERRQAQQVRGGVQLFCLVLTVLLVWQYHRFISAILAEAPRLPPRPDGAEAFLPIAAVVSLFHLVKTGEYDPIHPAALTILLAAILVSLLARKAFCAWVCPVGALSEWLASLGERCWGRTFHLPRWLDRPLLGVKYVLLAFFLFGIARTGDYYYYHFDRYADVAMYGYWFWGRFGPVMIVFATVTAVWSLFVRAPWCRYLCPYGALLGLFSRFSPTRITRNPEQCTQCGACARRCPSRIAVDRLPSVASAECTACLECTSACPVRDALAVRAGSRRLSAPRLAVLVGGLFFGGIGLAMLTGHWRTAIPPVEYRRVVPALRTGPRMPHRF
ncbi:MAG: 4Fe-4S binding protein [Armatimonadetes bacterium]|jgi:polyferredoxin|nr:4Fe-4S binding protein [Armatimonadota bacterium]